MEVAADKKNNCITLAAIENFDGHGSSHREFQLLWRQRKP